MYVIMVLMSTAAYPISKALDWALGIVQPILRNRAVFVIPSMGLDTDGGHNEDNFCPPIDRQGDRAIVHAGRDDGAC